MSIVLILNTGVTNSKIKSPFRYIEQPSLQVDRDELKGKDRYVRLSFKVDKAGNVTRVKIKKGSGIYALDEKVMQAVMGPKLRSVKPYGFIKIDAER